MKRILLAMFYVCLVACDGVSPENEINAHNTKATGLMRELNIKAMRVEMLNYCLDNVRWMIGTRPLTDDMVTDCDRISLDVVGAYYYGEKK